MNQLIKGQLQQLRSILQAGEHKKCRIRAHDDVEALERWLDEYFDKVTTYRSYKKEGERFLVWCALERKTSLSLLSRDDIEAYINFLKNPEPYEKWCGPKGGKTGSDTWRPFSGPLSESAIRCSLTILNSMMSYLLEAGYVEFNPFSLVRRKSRLKNKLDEHRFSIEERILTEDEWRAFLSVLHGLPENTEEERHKKQRSIFLVSILYFLGLRIDELAHASWLNFRKLNGKWWFFVRGKGDRLGKIPVNHHLWQAAMKFRFHLGKAVIPQEQDATPLIPSFTQPGKGLSARHMSNLLKDIAEQTALSLHDHPESARKLKRFSPHWLRHLSASRQDLAGISFTHIKENLRHQNEQTTRHYVHAFDDQRHKDMEKFDF